MFGLLLAVSSFSMVMKSRVEDKLAQQKIEQETRARLAADDLKQALEVDMLLESSYNSTIDIARARKYLSRSSGQTDSGGAPTLDNQTGTSLDGLTRQTTLIGVTDDSLLTAAITADSAATTFMSGYSTLPIAVFDAQASRQNQLSLSKQNLDAFAAQVLEFAKGNGRMPTTSELSTISSTTGLRTFWGSTFSNTANLFDVTSSFTSPWGGGDTYSTTVSVPYYTTNPPYTWATAPETTFTATDTAFENYMVVGNGVIVFAAATGSGTTYTYIFERQGSTWTEVQRIPGAGLSGYGLDIYENILAVSDVVAGKVEIFRRQNGTWEEVQELSDPDGGPTTEWANEVAVTRIGTRLYMYITDKNAANTNATVHYYISNSVDLPYFVYQGTVTPASCTYAHDLDVDAPTYWAGPSTSTPAPIMVVGCMQYSSNRGIAYAYQGTTLRTSFLPSTTNSGDLFGMKVSLNWPYLAIGAYQDEVSGPENGAVYIYQDLDKTFTKPNFSLMTHFEDATVTTCSTGEAYFGFNVEFIDDRSLAVNARCTNTLGSTNDSDAIIYTLTSAGWTKVRQISKSTVFASGAFATEMGGYGGIFAAIKHIDTTSPSVYVYTAPEF